MFGDDLTTIVAAPFGSSFGMTVFISHFGVKQVGAKIGYNVLCGIAFVVLCFTGFATVFNALLPQAAWKPRFQSDIHSGAQLEHPRMRRTRQLCGLK